MEIWHIWIIAAVFLFIVEIFTPGFVLACFGVACLSSAVVALLGLGIKAQIIVFSLTSLIMFFGFRPIFTKYFYSKEAKIKTNVDALPGKIGIVTEKIDPDTGTGRVKVGGEDWKGVSIDETIIEPGTKVEVIKVEGVKLLVKPATPKKEV